MTLRTLLAELDALEKKATPGEWTWRAGPNGEVQLEGNVEAPEQNPILVAHGCGNKALTEDGVQGCMPENLHDPLRACPLHPTKADRDLIARLVNAYRTQLRSALSRAERIEVAARALLLHVGDEHPLACVCAYCGAVQQLDRALAGEAT